MKIAHEKEDERSREEGLKGRAAAVMRDERSKLFCLITWLMNSMKKKKMVSEQESRGGTEVLAQENHLVACR